MPRAKEGGRDVLRGGLRFFALFPSAVLLWAEQSPAPYGRNSALLQRRGFAPPDGGFPLVKRSFYLVYHSFC